MLKYDTIKQLDDEYVMHTYNRFPALIVQGAGCSLWDNRGNEYLDFLGGIAVCQLGHSHPSVVAAISRQAQQLIHTSNYFLTPPQALLAEKLAQISGMERTFFAVCGTTANETALKLAKKHGLSKRPAGDYEIITLKGAFHGRSLGSLSGTAQPKYQEPFLPLIPGFVHIEANDIEALRNAVSEKTAAIHLEPIKGEGGVLPLTTEFLQEARKLADQFDAFLTFDEVQTGLGRTGKWFCYQHHYVIPDIVCVAKGLGGGMPIGACLARGKAATLFEKGEHGSTFGGNPVACAAGLAVIETIEREGLLQHTTEIGNYLKAEFASMKSVKSVRGYGLMIGVVLNEPNAREVVAACFERKFITNATDDYTLRIVPPLVLTKEQANKGLAIFAEVFGESRSVVEPAMALISKAPRHFLSIDDLSNDEITALLDNAAQSKRRRKLSPGIIIPSEDRTVAMVFEKPSLRTRVSFETAIAELGGHPVYLSKSDVGLGQREAVKDVASNLSRWCSLVVARLYWQRQIVEFASNSTVPVINALTEYEHPCQALADIMTVQEKFGNERVPITYVGDANNVARSLAKLALRLGYPFTICGPENFWLEPVDGLKQTSSLTEGLAGSKVVYTDVWISMGDEHEQEHRLKVFEAFQVNAQVMALAEPDAMFLHCLPARRGYEVTDEVIDSPQSAVVDQAENRLHVQKALIQTIMGW